MTTDGDVMEEADEGRRRQRDEVWTWMLMAELTVVAPVGRLVELHGGGGMYDEIVALVDVDGPDQAPVQVRCNRPGRVHVCAEVPDGGGWPARDLLGDIDDGLPPFDAARWVATQLRTEPAVPGGGSLADSVRAMSDILRAAVGAQPESVWEWRNGMEDTSGYGGGPRRSWFDAVAAAREACVARRGDLLGVPEYRFWFLLRDGSPLLAAVPEDGTLLVGADCMGILGDEAEDAWRAVVDPDAPLPPATKAEARERFARGPAPRLAHQVAGCASTVEPFAPGGKALSDQAAWLRSEGSLIVVVGPHEDRNVADRVLAWALAWQGDDDLALVLPESHVGLAPQRLAWIRTPVRLYSYGPELFARPVIVPARSRLLADAGDRPLSPMRPHVLGDGEPSVLGVMEDADAHWALVPAHRGSYLAWHCLGREVLRISRSGKGVAIRAGVGYSKPPAGAPEPLTVQITGPVSPVERAEVGAKVAEAVKRRFTGEDGGHGEHRFQAALAAGPLRDQLGLERWSAEYPAWRGEGRHGYMDFLGIDADGQLHVVETKVGTGDVAVVLQALDYAVWVQANAAAIRRERRWGADPERERVVIDLVLAPKGDQPAVGPYLAGQLEALAGDVPWRVSVADDPTAEIPLLTVGARRAVPKTALTVAVRPRRWAARVVGTPMPPPLFLPAAAEALTLLKGKGLTHQWVQRPHSSQAFALNLFAPLTSHGVRQVLGHLGADVEEVEPVTFEYSDPLDRLGEGKHRTQVDVVLRGATASGERVLALIEVKLTEDDFSGCGGYATGANPSRDVCCSSGLFGGERQRCFQLAGYGHGERHYADHFAETIPLRPLGRRAGGCALRGGLNQPMRNLALGRALVAAGEADRVIYGLCAPAGHRAIWRRFEEVRGVFAAEEASSVVALPAAAVVAAHQEPGGISARYPFLSDMDR